jgi:hypothetical protein
MCLLAVRFDGLGGVDVEVGVGRMGLRNEFESGVVRGFPQSKVEFLERDLGAEAQGSPEVCAVWREIEKAKPI